ncbi:bifunctional class I SAM-dependent methyltransferase/N-acetyltransferase [Streptomyces sp. ME02-6991-2A]|uniref:bifunctional class I SAM-dependent methyltransferase/N-acetyltransferase n=1 Tax=Streptomyces sp. ME02-6991-2A TaxID=3028677 RepID=UPI0029BF2B7E|nr:bifunctional class I SAM-dependent methyltransferase/N-acetyltransferase [Streptomyces sp. ME02-6991-2A]MDX3373678.1 bifunctional class I SAM-dependent methyltransferase/N-acetyltransferase [Streptomyces sp. ME02-6991-2A]
MTDHIDDASRTEAFFTLHHRLPRQSPGSDATTRRLLALVGPLPDRPRVLDLGCGPGRAALLLAAEAGAEVTAVDLHQPFLDELDEAAKARGLGDRIRTVRADMGDLTGPGFPAGSFDLIWAEGSAYCIGFATAVREWQRLLAPGGAMMISECVWTTDAPSAGARDFWDRNGSLRTLPETTAAAVTAGCTVSAVLLQPDSDWDTYYVPLAERVESAGLTAPGMSPGMEWALAATREELAVRREYGAEYGYAAYVLRPADPRWTTRPETAADREAVHAVNSATFPTRDEADLVDALRADAEAWLPHLSYVAEAPDGSVAAYALLTRCRVGDAPALALAPVATSPAHQRQGAGQAVVRAVLDEARVRGEALVVVLGDPDYYARFGFVPASRHGIRPGFEVPDEAMMALVLDDSVPVPVGMIRYPAAFGV